MEVSYEPYYELNEFFFSIIGLWPYQTKFKRRIITSFISLEILSLLLVQSLGLKKNWGDADTVINCLPPIILTMGGLTLLSCAAFNVKKMELLFSDIKRDWSVWTSGKEFEILRKYADRGRKYCIVFTILMYLFLGDTFAVPLAVPVILDWVLPLNESRPREALYITEYFVDEEEYFYWIAFHSCLGTTVVMTVIICVDTFFMVVLYHACGELAILGFKLQDLVRIDDSKLIIDEVQIHKEIKFCVERHESVIVFVNDICEYFSATFFMALGLNMLIMSVTGVQTVINLDKPRDAYAYAVFTVGQMVHLFCLSIPSQELIDHSIQLSESIYYGYWYYMSPESRKLLQIIMMRSAKPCSFTAAKLYVFSMENFAAIVRTSMSYFTVLSSVRE